MDEEDHDHPTVQSYLSGRRRGLVHSSAGSDTINGSSMSIISTVSSYRGSFSTSSSSSLPITTQNGNGSGESSSKAASSSGNSSDRRTNRTNHSLSSDYRGSLRSSLSSMPSLATITQDDVSSMPSLTSISHDGELPSSIFDVDSRTSWTTCNSRGSIRTLSPIPSPSASRRFHRGTLFTSILDDALAGRVVDELPICQLSLNYKDPDKEHRRWDCSIPTASNLIPLTPVLTDSIPTYSTRYSSSRLIDASSSFAGDGLDVIRAQSLDKDFTVSSPPTLLPAGAFGRKIHPVPALVLTGDETPRAARRRSSDVTIDSTEVPAQRSSWSDSSVSSTKRRSSTSAFPLPTLIEGGAVPYSSPRRGRRGMAEVAAMVADALGDDWSESETELPLTGK